MDVKRLSVTIAMCCLTLVVLPRFFTLKFERFDQFELNSNQGGFFKGQLAMRKQV